jgi:hypothetical protein
MKNRFLLSALKITCIFCCQYGGYSCTLSVSGCGDCGYRFLIRGSYELKRNNQNYNVEAAILRWEQLFIYRNRGGHHYCVFLKILLIVRRQNTPLALQNSFNSTRLFYSSLRQLRGMICVRCFASLIATLRPPGLASNWLRCRGGPAAKGVRPN